MRQARASGLARHAETRRQRTVGRVKRAIAALQRREEPVSLRRITAEANAQSPNGSRLCESVIARNPAAYALYLAARPQHLPRRHPGPRDRYLERLTKAKLIERIHRDRARIAQLENALAKSLDMAEHASDAP